MGFTTRHMLSVIGRHAGEFDISLPPASSIVILLVLLVPLSAFFSAVCLALATFARSSKEGQYYLTPMLMVTMGLTVFCLSPGVELTSSTAFYGILPIAGVALLLKGLLLNPQNGELYWLSIPVLVSSVGYSVAAIWWAIDQFRREEVLFREAEKFELRIWLKHLLRDKEPTPSFSEAVFCMVLFLVLMFVALGPLSSAGVNPDGTPNPRGALRAALIQQIGLYATPPLIMAVMLTSDFRRTMRLRWPGFRALGLGAALGICCLPLTLTLSRFVAPFFPPLPESLTKQISGMADPSLGWWFVLLVFAGAPAICEELAFRGFLLSGFHARGRTALAIILSAVCFGLVHMVPQQAFNAMLLGLLLGLLALRTQSLWPGVLMHFLNNALALGHGWATKELAEGRWSGNPFVAAALQQTPDGLQFTPLVVLVCAGVAAWVVRTLVLMPDLPTSPKAVPRSSGTARRPAAPAARVRVTEPESPVAAGRV